jgi:hypothetical protein
MPTVQIPVKFMWQVQVEGPLLVNVATLIGRATGCEQETQLGAGWLATAAI